MNGRARPAMDLDLVRRRLLAMGATSLAGLSGVAAHAAPESVSRLSQEQHVRAMTELPPDAPKVAMLVHPRMVALDLIGPMTVFKVLRFDVQLVWKDRSPVITDLGLTLTPTHTFAGSYPDVDVLFVPGGTLGTIECMKDRDVCDYLADRGSRAKWVTSVCTGSLLLGAAGLLKGYEATAHWAVADLLPLFGARHVERRVVRDRNRLTGGGVTAGIDFALILAAHMRGEEAARSAQLTIEYAPDPPFANGTPAQAGPQRTQAARNRRRGMDEEARRAAQSASRRLG